jgi:hypothetical protein
MDIRRDGRLLLTGAHCLALRSDKAVQEPIKHYLHRMSYEYAHDWHSNVGLRGRQTGKPSTWTTSHIVAQIITTVTRFSSLTHSQIEILRYIMMPSTEAKVGESSPEGLITH